MADVHVSAYVRSETHQFVTTIEFFHPQSNSLPARLLEDLSREIHSAANDENSRVIILRSAGVRAFCAGASFEELAAIKNKEEGLAFFNGFAEVINAMRKCPKFIIGRIHGKSVGGGVGLAAAVDYAIAVEGAEVRLSELSIGFGPFVVGPAIERKIGIASLSSLTVDAMHWRNADWAKRKGLYSELHPNIEAMDESISRLANHLAHSNPEAMSEIKKMLWAGTEGWDELMKSRAAISGKLALSSFTQQAIAKSSAKKG